MVSAEQAVAALIVLVLLALAVFYGWRQVRVLRWLGRQADLAPDDRRYLRTQVGLRLAGCGLMLVLAGLLGGSFFIFDYEERATQLGAQGEAQNARNEKAELNPEQRSFLKFYTRYWIAALLVLLGIVLVAAFDLWSTRRFARRHLRQIQADRRAMLEQELALLRHRRNGHVL